MNNKKLMNIIIKKLCSKEAGKKQLDAGEARQVLKCVSELLHKDPEFLAAFIDYINLSLNK